MAEILYKVWSISLDGWVEKSIFDLELLKLNVNLELGEYDYIVNTHVVYIIVAFSVNGMVVVFSWKV